MKQFIRYIFHQAAVKWHYSLLFILCNSLSIQCSNGKKDSATDLNNTEKQYEYIQGAITRGNTDTKEIALVFTGDEYADGADQIVNILKKREVQGSFFFTGNFFRNPLFKKSIQSLVEDGHYIGAHSDSHLLYCDWIKRDSLLITKEEFENDLLANYREMERFGIRKQSAPYFLPPYEWYNDSISGWTNALGLQLINFTQGTLSHADYTTPSMVNYRSCEEIYASIVDFEKKNKVGLSGFILLIHLGTSPERTDKCYSYLEKLIPELQSNGYGFARIDELLTGDKPH
ncbi:MAG: polysaccharide deacetylase family protein [Bacteroidia bacterium]|nr:polysaccharide deacetylase family protein [Bacteroidia bacterium]